MLHTSKFVIKLKYRLKAKIIMSECQRILSFFTLFILICIFLEYAAAQSKDYSNICINHPPTKTAKTNNESKWSYEDKAKERHMHYGNKIARMRIASVLQGKVVDDAKEDYSKFCLAGMTNYLQGHAEVDFYGYGEKRADFICSVREGNTGALDCVLKHSNGYSIKAVFYPHYEEKVLTTTWCFEDGEVGWLAMSIHDDLTPEEDKKTMEYITSLGFDPKDKVPTNNPSCGKKF